MQAVPLSTAQCANAIVKSTLVKPNSHRIVNLLCEPARCDTVTHPLNTSLPNHSWLVSSIAAPNRAYLIMLRRYVPRYSRRASYLQTAIAFAAKHTIASLNCDRQIGVENSPMSG